MRARWAPLLALLVVAGMAALTALGSGAVLATGAPPGRPRGADGVWVPMGLETPRPRDVQLGQQPPLGDNTAGDLFGKVLVGLVALTLVLVLAYVVAQVVRRLRRTTGLLDGSAPVAGLVPRSGSATATPPAPTQDDGVPLPPDDAVVALWRRLERTASGRGIARRQVDSSGDLVRGILAAGPVDAPALRRLERHYLRAVYAGRRVTPADAEAAATLLGAVEASWGVR